MQSKIPKILFSSLLRKFSHLPRSPIVEKSPSLLPLAQFSTIPNRPVRGDRRRDDDDRSEGNRPLRGDRRRDDDNRSEGNFFRKHSFRDRDNAEKPYQNPSPRLPNRPLRGGDQRTMRRDIREKDDGFHQNPNAGSQDFRGVGENNEKRSDVSMKFGGGEKERVQLGDTLLDKLNLGEMGSGKRAEEMHTNTRAGKVVDGADPSVPESPPEDADEIFKKMKETGLIPNSVAMLDGLCKDGLIQEAMKLFGLMREKGTIPEVVIYTAVVEGFCKAAKFDDAKRIFRKMQKNGIVPNAFSYAIVIQGLCKGKRLEDAVEFCVEMLEAGHSPNPATFTGLVSEFCKEKGVDEAEGLVRSLREKGFAMDDKAVREYLDKKGPYMPMVWEAIFGKKVSKRPF